MPEHVCNLADWQVLAAKDLGAVLLPVKPQPCVPEWVELVTCHALDGGRYGFFDEDREYRCPLGAPGDTVVGREALRRGCDVAVGLPDDAPATAHVAEFAADGTPVPGRAGGVFGWQLWRWWGRERLPAQHTPRELARWRWTNAGVRVVRLAQDLTEEDALACGIEVWRASLNPKQRCEAWLKSYAGGVPGGGVLPEYQWLLGCWWNITHGKRYPWESAVAWLVRLAPEVSRDH